MLKIKHLKKSYENFSLDCSLEVKKGHVTGLIGQNGAGKSTTFKAILGLISFDSGTINILGKSLQDFTAKVIMNEDTDVLLSDYALLKVDEEEYSKLDRQYILRTKKESYGYSCLTNQKQYYAENYPQMAIEKGNIDEVITMMIRGVE